MTLLPTIVEFLLIIGVCAIEFDWRYIVTIVSMIVIYLWFTIQATNWRVAIRKTMNDSDTDANTKAIDSLLNYETVKYFGAEEREASRYDRSMETYEKASIKTYTSLAVLNTGQAIIFTIALTICLVMAAQDVVAGKQTVGHFAMVNLLMLQLFMPLNFMGMVYREIKQGLTDIEKMMEVLDKNPEVADRPDAKDLHVNGGAIRFDHVKFAYDPERVILQDVSFEVPAGKMFAIVGPSGAGKSTISRILLRFYDVTGGAVTIDGQDLRAVTQKSLARRDRRRAAGYGAVQRYDFLQHQVWPARSLAGRSRRGSKARADRRLHEGAAGWLRYDGWRARLEIVWRGETTRCHCAHDIEGPADPYSRRGDERTRQPYGKGNPRRTRPRFEKSHDACHCAPLVDHRACRPDSGA